MPFWNIEVCKPAYIAHATPLFALLILPIASCPRFVIVGYTERHIAKPITDPHLIVSQKRENILIGDGVLIADDEKPLVILKKLSNKFRKQRKRRIGDDNIGLLEKLDALCTAEIAIATEAVDANLVGIWHTVADMAASALLALKRFQSWLR